jgi:phosphoglycolate phosphatase
MSTHYKHVIWDWNGTLLNDTLLCVEVLNGLMARRGRAAISNEEYRQNFGFPVARFYDYLGFDTDVDSFDQISREFIQDYEARWFQECQLHPDAASVLSDLSAVGMSHSVLSAAKQEALNAGIDHFGIRKHFIGLVGADNIYAEGKVAQGRNWVEQLHWRPDEIVLVGDTLHDFEVAQAIGADCILLGHGHHASDRLAETGVPVAHSLRELAQLLKTNATTD